MEISHKKVVQPPRQRNRNSPGLERISYVVLRELRIAAPVACPIRQETDPQSQHHGRQGKPGGVLPAPLSRQRYPEPRERPIQSPSPTPTRSKPPRRTPSSRGETATEPGQ